VEENNKLYVMISKTHTGIGKAIRMFSRYPYNHVALTLDSSFRNWVSFARYNRDTPLYGGFTKEPVERYFADETADNTVQVKVFALDITKEHHKNLSELFSCAGDLESGMVYNFFDIIAATVGAKIPVANAYTCLGFARAVLQKDYRSIKALDKDLESHLIYQGPLQELVSDSGNRTDLYFTRLGFIKGTRKTFKSFTVLTLNTIKAKSTDKISRHLNNKTVNSSEDISD